ncbi:SpoIIE family protein phosphatase [Desulfovibrio aerotolerans]|uniref:SpoIIE family protein phosphatase n=1 Tax=Solidesulfovibrio aerotolerans TaxID=295255 RepID=A0A7C9MVZ8_9BACT|nr:SpoIIE family protein phosphatase [Solidesulfovibrio aerotolerans]MYL84014.1 SpoIIE family protein phosphatase [Solidesulfovibrio aerotolerans]
MRIRTKLLIILLALVLPPLVAVSFYALREARLLGDELATKAAESFKHAAESELALMVDLIGEDVADNRKMLDLALAFFCREASNVLEHEPTDPAAAVPADFDLPSLDGPPGMSREAVALAGARFTRLAPTLGTLQHKLGDTMLWAYLALSNGIIATIPPHGPMPAGYDARERPWYQAAVAKGSTVWSILIDATSGRLTATVSAPILGHDGALLGVAAIDAPLEALLPESDLSRRWGDGVRASFVRLANDRLEVIGSRDFLDPDLGWKTPLAPVPLPADDPAGLARLTAAVEARHNVQVALTLGGEDYFAVLRPFSEVPAGLLVLVPRQAVLHQADSAESAILARTRSMMAVVVSFALLAVAASAILAYFGSRAVTRPLTGLSLAAARLAEGDLDARAPVTSRDELGRLGETFNAMAPKLAERLRLKQDMLLAKEVQQNLLPKAPPHLPGIDLAGATIFCDETGGDYFDYLSFAPAPDDGCDIIVGDATGHGIAAALFMATGRALLRGGQGVGCGPAALLTLANALLWQDTADSGRFITLYFLRLERGGLADNGRLLWSRAGHDPAMIYDPATDRFEELLGPGLPLGVLPDYVYEEQSCPGLTPGQVLLLGTDGIWEARNPADEMYGKDRFREVVRAHATLPAEAIVAAVHADVAAFQANSPRDDDITLVVLKALPV